MKKLLSYWTLNSFLFLMSITTMSFALFFLQKHLGLAPCPLCIFQRIGMIVMGIFSLLATLTNPKKKWARIILWIGSFAGVSWSTAVAGRHVWMQHLPADQIPSCGPGLNFLLETFPLSDVLNKVFNGSGECAEIAWSFLGLSIPEQSLVVFGFMFIVHIYLLKIIVTDKSS